MEINGVASHQAADESQSSPSSGELDRHAFLKLLVAQLERQDPLEPVNQENFIAQLAQFSSLEHLTNMSESLDVLVELALQSGGQSQQANDTLEP